MFYLKIFVFLLGLYYTFAGPLIYEVTDLHPPNVVHLNLTEKNYYLGIHFKLNFFEAAEFCRYHGMQLATITSQDENDKLFAYMNLMGIQEHIWLSGSDLGHEGNFVWLSTGTPLSFKNFMNGQPDNFKNVEHCLEIWQFGKWNDRPCADRYYFACEF